MSVTTWVILNDLQIPFHDVKVLDAVLALTVGIKPDGVILNGDVVDCYSLSEFDKDPATEASLTREITDAAQLMARLKGIPEKWWLGGNHEDRLRRVLWQNPKFASIEKLDFPKLFDLETYGFKWKPYGGTLKLASLLVTHGSMVLKHSGWTAREHFIKYGTSVLIGHTHRLGVYYRTNSKGVHASYENGCLCKLTPEYAQAVDWQQGFSVVHLDGNYFNVQQIPIINRRCFFYGGDRYEV